MLQAWRATQRRILWICLIALTAATCALAAAPVGAVSYGPSDTGSGDVTGQRRITGGNRIAITAAPWQVRLKVGADGLCGGAIIDASHVVTAGHCTYEGLSPLPTSAITVVSGSSSFNPDSPSMAANGRTPPDDPVSSGVASIRTHPGYIASADGWADARDGRDDVAVLTLKKPLNLDGRVRQAIALPERNSDLPIGTVLSVSGFGLQSGLTTALDGGLHRLRDVRVLDPVPRTGAWNSVYVTATSDSGLFCFGDSGGPLVSGSGNSAVIVGLVAFSPSCHARTMAVFTRTSAGEIRDFILGDDTPPAAPTGGRDILLTSDRNGTLPLVPGRVLNCFPGTWTHRPAVIVTFFDSKRNVLQAGAGRKYTVSKADIGRRIACQAIARTEGGVGRSPATTAPPAVEPAASRTLPPKTRASLSVSLRSNAGSVYRGESVGVSMRIYSRGRNTAKNPQACVSVPAGWQVRSMGAAKLYGRSLCYKIGMLHQYELAQTTVSLRPTRNLKAGTTQLKVRAAADNAAAAFGSRSFRVR